MTEEKYLIIPAYAEVENPGTTLARINRIAEETGSVIVLFDAEKVAGTAHIRSAADHAVRAFENGRAVARTLAMEMLLYASGQRQCSLAPRFGLHEGPNHLYILIYNGDWNTAADAVLRIVQAAPVPTASHELLMQEFGITPEEISVVGSDRIEELVIERVALLDTYK